MIDMRALFYISTIRGGGAARAMVNLANGMIQRGHEVCFVTNFPDKQEYSLTREIKRINIERSENKSNVLKKNISRITKLRRILKKEAPDVSIAFMGENNFRLIIAAIGLKIKTIVSVRSDPEKEYRRKASKQIAYILYPHADGIVFQTDDAKEFFPRKLGKKSTIIFNQVDDKFFSKNHDNGQYIIASGRLTPAKNYPMLLHAFKKVHDVFPDETLRIYGDGQLEADLKKQAESMGLDQSICFMGFSDDMSENYKKAKFLVLTSDYEGMPNAVLEALASSVPVISTDCPCGGPKMVIRDDVNGYLVPVGDFEKCAERMLFLLKNPDKLAALKEQAYESSKLFKSDAVLNQWIQYMSSVISE